MSEDSNEVGTGNKLLDKIAYAVFPGTTVTVCRVTLINGFSVIGQSACLDSSEYDEDKGKGLALKDAVDQLPKFYGFLLKQRQYEVGLQVDASETGGDE